LFPAAKVRLSEQNTKQKEKFFYFCLYFRAQVSSTIVSKVIIKNENENENENENFFRMGTKNPEENLPDYLFFNR
jgi:hypothetical protein